ncbi:hypothetical protein U1Q18_005383, partial [Sarracenia purpurea var. burkii]
QTRTLKDDESGEEPSDPVLGAPSAPVQGESLEVSIAGLHGRFDALQEQVGQGFAHLGQRVDRLEDLWRQHNVPNAWTVDRLDSYESFWEVLYLFIG